MFESIAWFGKRAPRAHLIGAKGHYLVYDKKVLKFQNMIGEYMVYDQKSVNLRNMYAYYMAQDERSIFLGGQQGQILTSDAQNLNFTSPSLKYLVQDEQPFLMSIARGEYGIIYGQFVLGRMTNANYAANTPGRSGVIGIGANAGTQQQGIVGFVSNGASMTVLLDDRDKFGIVGAVASYTTVLEDPYFGIVGVGGEFAAPTQNEQAILIGEHTGFYAVGVPLFSDPTQTEV